MLSVLDFCFVIASLFTRFYVISCPGLCMQTSRGLGPVYIVSTDARVHYTCFAINNMISDSGRSAIYLKSVQKLIEADGSLRERKIKT